jgi:nucleoside-diphosphate-sugar epimerase
LDFTYVDDFVEGIMLAMKEKNKEFDLSFGKSIKVKDVADMVINFVGKGTKQFCCKELAQPQEIELDISAIRKLGYVPRISIEEGLKRTFEWYRENLDEILKSRE